MWSQAARGCWGGCVSSLNTELNRLLGELSPDMAKMVRIAHYKEAYVSAVRKTWRENPDGARYILEHTNAFYIRKDDRPRKGPEKDKPHILCEVVVDDPIVRSELNMRQEMLRLSLAYDDIHFDEFRIIPAKLGMRNRHPFAQQAAETDAQSVKAGLERPLRSGCGPQGESGGRGATTAEKQRDLITVKRAFCLALGEGAQSVLAKVRAADLEPVRDGGASVGKRSRYRAYWLHLYVEDEGFSKIMQAYVRPLIASARDLGLYLRAVQVHPATDEMRDKQAFPAVGTPEVLKERVSHGQ